MSGHGVIRDDGLCAGGPIQEFSERRLPDDAVGAGMLLDDVRHAQFRVAGTRQYHRAGVAFAVLMNEFHPACHRPALAAGVGAYEAQHVVTGGARLKGMVDDRAPVCGWYAAGPFGKVSVEAKLVQ